MGIGLNYGPAVLGDVGSEQTLSFTVIGDTVNTASGLQGLTRSLATPLVVADAVVQAIHETANGDIAAALGKLRDRGVHEVGGASRQCESGPAMALASYNR